MRLKIQKGKKILKIKLIFIMKINENESSMTQAITFYILSQKIFFVLDLVFFQN